MPAPYYRFFVGDYLRDAGHLSLLEHGAYRRLIDLYMIGPGPLPFDMQRLYRLLHATSKEEQAAVQVVIEEFFHMDGAVLRHRRCDRELAWQQAMSDTARANVAARERKRAASLLPPEWNNEEKQVIANGGSSGDDQTIIYPDPDPDPVSTPLTTNVPRVNAVGSRFALTDAPAEWLEMCRRMRPDLDPDTMFEEFKDYWTSVPGSRGVKLIWIAVWRNRLRTYSGVALGKKSRHSPTGQHMAGVMRDWLKSKEKEK